MNQQKNYHWHKDTSYSKFKNKFNINDDIDKIISESCFTGIATQQTEDYLREVRAVLAANREFLDKNIDVSINV